MKFNYKALAAVAALAVTGAAHADLTPGSTGNGSFALLAFNQVTQAYYVRDLGYALNSFLPNSITTAAGDGGVTGDKTPDAGLNIVWGTDANWTSFMAGASASDIRWTVTSGDSLTANASQGVARNLVSFMTGTSPTSPVQNSVVRNSATAPNGVGGLASQNNPMGTSATGATVLGNFLSNNLFGAGTLGLLDTASNLFYYYATASTGSSTTAANFAEFANSTGNATLTLGSNGTLTYDLEGGVAAVPIPAAAWLFGSGLVGLGGTIRRRKGRK